MQPYGCVEEMVRIKMKSKPYLILDIINCMEKPSPHYKLLSVKRGKSRFPRKLDRIKKNSTYGFIPIKEDH